MDDEMIKFEKILTINDDPYENLEKYSKILFDCMKESNKINGINLRFFSLRTRGSRCVGAIDMVLEWLGDKI